jgi:hypothetical protein
MGTWTSALLVRIAAVAALALFATATIGFAASKKLDATTAPAPAVATPKPSKLVVPDVRGQAYVFAKGILEDAGFAWTVSTKNGYSANTVVSQSPAPGTRVVDNGLPTVTLSLQRNAHYKEKGSAENASPFDGTTVRLPGAIAPASATPPAAPADAAPAAAAPAAAPKPTAPAAPAAKPVRKPDFVVPGAPKEPQNELPLTDRARLLDKWLTKHPEKTAANANHWLYQHQWIVTGAKFGWWHGAEALKVLIATDRRVQAKWGIGARSEAAAREALAEVERAK